MALEEQFYEIPAARWRRTLPWLRLFRGFRMSLDARKLMLAVLGLLVFWAGQWAFDRLPFSPTARQAKDPVASTDAWLRSWLGLAVETSSGEPVPVASMPASFPGGAELLSVLTEPWRQTASPAVSLTRRNQSWSDVAWGWTNLVWALVVWAVFGGAIARIAALDVAGRGSIGLRGALRHSTGHLVSYLGGPLLPIIGFGIFWLLSLVVGLVGHIPSVGPTLLGAAWFVPLCLGVLQALILAGALLAWPLMYCTISVEGSDAFDAMSRAYSYLFSRPWQAAWLTLLSALYGVVVTLFLLAVVAASMHLAQWSVSTSFGADGVQALTEAPLFGASSPAAEAALPGPAMAFAGFWRQIVAVLLLGYVHSFFWTMSTIAYFVLRHAEDATPFEQMYVPSEASGRTAGPVLSGMAAAERREQAAGSPSPAETSPDVSPDRTAGDAGDAAKDAGPGGAA
ncbi:MAG: hypothetical protein KF774_11070 [Planctomyces sp.]|nr:hypothetical protein [Planctomyces sp.]